MVRGIVIGWALTSAGIILTCMVSNWLQERKERNQMNRAVRLAQDIHPLGSAPEFFWEDAWDCDGDLDLALMGEQVEDEVWVENGLEWLSCHATWAQRPSDELEVWE